MQRISNMIFSVASKTLSKQVMLKAIMSLHISKVFLSFNKIRLEKKNSNVCEKSFNTWKSNSTHIR